MNLDRAINISDMRRLAMRRLPRMAFDFIDGGCDDEDGLRENEADFAAHRLVPRYLVDVSRRDTTTRIAGQTFALPLGFAPTGAAGIFRHDADRLLARAAAAANVPFVLSNASNASIEDAARVAPDHTWFQLYGSKNWDMAEDMVRRAADNGVKTLVLSVDVPAPSNRERNRRNNFSQPLRVTPSMVFQALMHPAWTLDYFRNGGLPHMGNFRPYAAKGASAAAVGDLFVSVFPAPALTWGYLEKVRRLWRQKLFIKGIMHPDDALRAAEMGVDGVMVSNHGGRQLDRAPSPLRVLPLIHAAVGDRVEIALDGGVRRGSDIVIALCLGARMVFMGRPPLYGVAAAGQAGAKKVVDILTYELNTVLAQMGCARTADLGPRFLLSNLEADPTNMTPARAAPRPREAASPVAIVA
jgi:L-lactate dehydrogenase (cytochrome)/(S)-mandelate dehydrogenase